LIYIKIQHLQTFKKYVPGGTSQKNRTRAVYTKKMSIVGLFPHGITQRRNFAKVWGGGCVWQ